ncbi:hypothetical protein GSUB_05865 [Geoalkalibacter subterraneus]|uniref:Uncharacterized protein n=1 Tax=Geoalkalibacter subterraneus TaxID=483547 RepID=A0A0B5FRI5_9BACT|nr:hypothetical protein GSUB_05865 [Geoalkalibacter subterraneus]
MVTQQRDVSLKKSHPVLWYGAGPAIQCPGQNAKKAPVLHGAFLVSPHLPWAVGLTTSTNQVGFSQAASGVPLKGGLAHSNPLGIPIQNYSAWAFLASPVG